MTVSMILNAKNFRPPEIYRHILEAWIEDAIKEESVMKLCLVKRREDTAGRHTAPRTRKILEQLKKILHTFQIL